MLADCTQIDFRNGTVAFSKNNKFTCGNGTVQIFASGSSHFEDFIKHTGKDDDGESLKLASYKTLLSIGLSSSNTDNVINIINNLSDPYSLIYYQPENNMVIVGRDLFGKKSLLWSLQDDILKLSPTVMKDGLPLQTWYDVPPGVISFIYLNKDAKQRKARFYTVFINEGAWFDNFDVIDMISNIEVIQRFSLNHDLPFAELNWRAVADSFITQFKYAIRRTLYDVNKATQAVAVPFSGGIDSLLVAYTVLDYLPTTISVDLINVAFGSSMYCSTAPDRVQSIKAFRFLKAKYPHHGLRLIIVNVTQQELQQCLTEHIALAVAPSCSVLDESIACVMWFAARAEGVLYDETLSDGFIPTRSNAIIVIVGSGADELFGGYMKYRKIFEKGGRDALLDVLQNEIKIIGERNLGRDDRIVSSFKKDLRVPFLDNTFVNYVSLLPLEYKVDLKLSRGRGEKKLLREALKALGTPEELYTLPKRAMQFGSRVTKLEGHNEKGGDYSLRLINAINYNCMNST